MATVLVTGANRGIGLSISRQLKERGDDVIGVCRKASDELKAVSKQVVEGINVSEDACVEKLRQALKGQKIDVVINNAGLLESNSLNDFDFESMARQFQVNTLGPLRVTQAILPILNQGAKILNVTSRMGSIADNSSGGYYGYRMSKAALNMATVSLAKDLEEKGIAVGLVHPGYVKTDMTGHNGDMLPDEAAKGIIKRLDELNLETTSSFWHSNGETLPW